MKKTFVTVMPNHIGAFLKASRCFAELGVNITRVSYNKAVDSHTLFIDAEGTAEQLEKASEMLEKINKLGIGPGGLGGTQTALAVNIETYTTHIAGLPVAVNICCHVNRHVKRVL